MFGRRIFWLSALVLLGGCATSPQPSEFTIGPGAYPEAFEVARDELRRAGFEVERVDARSGVITTRSKGSSGIATPWNQDESSLGQEFTALAHHRRRKVIVRFEPLQQEAVETTATGQSPVGSGEQDLRLLGGDLRVSVVVLVEEYRRLGKQVDPVSIRLTSVSRDVSDPDQPMPKRYVFAVDPDEHLSGRLAQAMSARVGSAESGS